jgi:hypothetical protein
MITLVTTSAESSLLPLRYACDHAELMLLICYVSVLLYHSYMFCGHTAKFSQFPDIACILSFSCVLTYWLCACLYLKQQIVNNRELLVKMGQVRHLIAKLITVIALLSVCVYQVLHTCRSIQRRAMNFASQ